MRTIGRVAVIGLTIVLAFLVDQSVTPHEQFVSAPFAIPVVLSAYWFAPRGVVLTAALAVIVAAASAAIDRAPPVPSFFHLSAVVVISALALQLGEQRRVTTQRAREAEEARQEVSRILSSITDAFAAFDQQGRFTYLNPEAARLLRAAFGVVPGELLGKSLWEDYPELEGTVFERELRRVMADRVAVTFEACVPNSGVWLEVHAYPSAEGVSVFVRDVTERMRAMEEREALLRAVEEERARLATILSNTANAVLYVQVAPERVQANAAAERIFGHPFLAEGGRAQYATQIRYPDGRPVARESLPSSRALQGERVVSEELIIRQPDLRRVPVLVSGAPVRGPGGQVIGAVVVYQDISPLKELERLREEWTSVVAHDLRQPVTVVLGYADILARTLSATDFPVQHRAAEQIQTAIRNLNRMIEDLLDVSRIETRRLRLERRPVDLAGLVRAVMERTTALTTGHPVHVEVAGQIPPIEADPTRIEQVLANLLANAAAYGFPRTEILVRIARRGDGVEISVTNQGPGIAPADLPRLFTRFFRTSQAQASRVGGLGLGLAIGKGIVEAHGGRIWAESTPGQTTTFTFTLPIASTEG